jgi:23S rRNA pseudouridine2605 synthase
MMMVLQMCVILSGVIEAVLGIWLAVAGQSHPVVRWLLDLGAPAQGSVGSAPFIGIFLALGCFLAAGLNVLIWSWLREDRDEAYALINLYGGFAFLGGIALFAAFSTGRGGSGASVAAWIPLVVDSLRGAALLAIGNVVHYAPMTVRELRLPERAPGTPRPSVGREAARSRGEEGRPGRHADRRGGRDRGGARAPSGPPRPQPMAAPAPSASSPRRPAAAVPSAAVDDSASEADGLRRRSRGRRGGRRGRAGRGEEQTLNPPAMAETPRGATPARATVDELVVRPLPPAATGTGERDRERDELHREERFRERHPREDRPREDRPREDHPREGRRRDERRREDRPRRESQPSAGERAGRPRERDFRSDRAGEEEPRRFDRPPSRSFSAVRPPSARMTEPRRISESDAASAPERGEFEGGRRPKRGRYSTGALFRPREKRVHRALGGEATSRWGWPEPEGGAKPAGAPDPAVRRAEGRAPEERPAGPLRDEGGDE